MDGPVQPGVEAAAEAHPEADEPGAWTAARRSLALVLLALVPFLLIRLALLRTYWPDFEHLSGAQVALAFLDGLRFDLATILPALALPLAMLNLPLPVAADPRWRRGWGWLGFVTVVPMTLLLGGDLVYYREVHRHITRELVLIAHDTSFLAAMTWQHLPTLLLAAAFLGGLAYAWSRALARPHRPIARGWVTLLVLAVLVFLGIRGSLGRKPLSPIDAYQGQSFPAGNLALNGVYTAIRAAMSAEVRRSNPLSYAEACAELRLDPEQHFPAHHPAPASVASTSGAPRNVVMVLLESWDARYMGCYGAARSFTPCIDALAPTSRVYDQAYASTQRTIGGIQATLTGIPCVPGIPELGQGLEHAAMTRVGALAKARGYHTLFLQVPRRRSYYLDSITHSLGFDEVYGMEDFPVTRDYPEQPQPKWGWDYDGLQFALSKMRALPEPFLVVILTGTTHSPYAHPGAPFDLVPHEEHGLGGYENTLAYSDWALGEMLKGADQEAFGARTVWLLSADHVMRSVGQGDVRESFRIPVLLRGAGIQPGRVSEVYSQLDYLPTILDLIGVQTPRSTLGTSLLGPSKGYAVVSQGDVLGIVSPRAYLTHTVERRIEARGLDPAVGPAELDGLERRLLAVQRLTTSLVHHNRWAPAEGD
ncbi:MAG: LTA synthase family protein [Planctomycetota bacterium]